jgi:hypothetical protein
MTFWQSTRQWFEERGYALFKEDRSPLYNDPPDNSNNSDSESCHPYSFSCGDGLHGFSNVLPLYPLTSAKAHRHLKGRIFYAQDTKRRHVVIKIVKDGSHEYQIFRLLSQEQCLFSLRTFPGVLPAVDFLRCDKHWMVVMPRCAVFFSHFSCADQRLDGAVVFAFHGSPRCERC